LESKKKSPKWSFIFTKGFFETTTTPPLLLLLQVKGKGTPTKILFLMLILCLPWGSWGFDLDWWLSLMEVDYPFQSYDSKCLHNVSWPMSFSWHFYDGIDTLSSDLFQNLKFLMILCGYKVWCSIDGCLEWVSCWYFIYFYFYE